MPKTHRTKLNELYIKIFDRRRNTFVHWRSTATHDEMMFIRTKLNEHSINYLDQDFNINVH